eukprot:3995495-Pyramimonas_sp.AAC.1
MLATGSHFMIMTNTRTDPDMRENTVLRINRMRVLEHLYEMESAFATAKQVYIVYLYEMESTFATAK